MCVCVYVYKAESAPFERSEWPSGESARLLIYISINKYICILYAYLCLSLSKDMCVCVCVCVCVFVYVYKAESAPFERSECENARLLIYIYL